MNLRSPSTALAVTAMLCLTTAVHAQALRVKRVATGLDRPTFVCTRPGETRPLFVVEQDQAQIRIVKSGQVQPTPFLDLNHVTATGFEVGLMSMAFHPDYHANGRFFVTYVRSDGDSVVAEYRVSADDEVADPVEVATLLVVPQPADVHNVGHISFGPGGHLYVGSGDGGPGQDPTGAAQDGLRNLGKLLRLDVDAPPLYIPADNPFVGNPEVNDEIWALGLRNPWRFSFDAAQGDLWLGDVGEHAREEIDYLPAGTPGGANFGWRCEEGSHCTGLSGCDCDSPALTRPVFEYTHAGGNCAILGGYVYRGRALPWMRGRYLFGDFCSGRVWSLATNGGQPTDLVDHTGELLPAGGGGFPYLHSFGVDGHGELYLVDGGLGEIYQIAPECGVSNFCTTSPNSFSKGARISAVGSTSLADAALAVEVDGAVPSQTGVFFYSWGLQSIPFGDGLLCVGSPDEWLYRLDGTIVVDSQGQGAQVLDFSEAPLGKGPGRIEPGHTWHFQFWYRDPAGPGGSGFNVSDALRVTFCP